MPANGSLDDNAAILAAFRFIRRWMDLPSTTHDDLAFLTGALERNVPMAAIAKQLHARAARATPIIEEDP